MSDGLVFFHACIKHPACGHLYDQEMSRNHTRFLSIARMLVPGWPVTANSVTERYAASTDFGLQQFLIASGCQRECGYNQYAPYGKCMYLSPVEHESSMFVTIVFGLGIICLMISGVVFYARMQTNRTEGIKVNETKQFQAALKKIERWRGGIRASMNNTSDTDWASQRKTILKIVNNDNYPAETTVVSGSLSAHDAATLRQHAGGDRL